MKRFWDKVKIAGPNECWEWQAAIGTSGYGKMGFNGKSEYAHRVCFILEHHEIPKGLVVMHTCDNRICVNPKHLKLGTQKENLKDMTDKGRRQNQNTNKTHCKRNHPLFGDNLFFDTGTRQCRTCKRIRRKELYARSGC
jgi:hypothetical protein